MQILNDLNFNLTAFIVNIISFVLLYLFLRKFLFGPVGAMLDGRQADINATYDDLDRDRAEMNTLKTDYEKRLAGIESEAREKIQGAIKEAQGARDQIVNEASVKARETLSRAESEANREREQAMIQLREQMVTLALGAAEKVVKENLNDDRNRRLVDDFIASGTANGVADTNGTASRVGGVTVASAPPVGGLPA